MAFEGSNRRARLPTDWPTRRARVLARDGNACQVITAFNVKCLRLASEVDHITPGDDHTLDNLQAICSYHHGVKTGAEGGHAAYRSRRVKSEQASHYKRPV